MAVATLVERSTRDVRVVPLHDGYKADAAREAITRNFRDLPSSLRRSLTWGRGREMAEHRQLAADLELDVSFCDPRLRVIGSTAELPTTCRDESGRRSRRRTSDPRGPL